MNKFKLNKIIILIFFLFNISTFSQTRIEMEEVNGVYMIPCKVNGLPLKFIFDTGASDVTISKTEALFMIKNGYLRNEDIGDKEYYTLANGNTVEGIVINLKEIEIGGVKIENIKASVVLEQKAPLLLGQSALQKLGTYKIIGSTFVLEDYSSNTVLSILDKKNGFKTLKLGTKFNELPYFFKTAEFAVNKKENLAIGIIKDAPDEFKTIFDIKMDFLVVTIDLDTKTLNGIQLLKVYSTIIEDDKTVLPSVEDYKYLNYMYYRVLGVKPSFFKQDFLDSKKIASTEGGYSYWKGENVLLSVGNELSEVKLTKDYKPASIFNLKITYTKNENQSLDSLFDKF
ncbi:retropepsin-like aspartic protease family protein [Flavobacterium haoranii]|uniref:Clan AA aspartic protease, TIGR02281 family n=1 Tax=Flavobacterium haoranii TaxID=683124 RepID=A0A1M6H4P8_9FLAO|nr:retropepsin-like aspartic protease [Flavobacterium haoranii]SHJ17163.1 clan AA aspartic protease, TIGR02281 family [Flavobacterium haoranii]